MKIPVVIVALILLIAAVGNCRGDGLQENVNIMETALDWVAVAGDGPGQDPAKIAHGRADIEVFVTSWCGYCRKMIGFLREKGIPFTVHDIEKDSNAARAYRELGGTGVPVVRIGSHVVHGYNPEAVMEYYSEGK
jgi:glutaredoxin